VKDQTAPLKTGDGLTMVMLPSSLWTDCQPRTLDCIYVLEASELVMRRNSTEGVDDAVNDALVPVHDFCKALTDYTGRTTQQDGALSSSYQENFADLKTHMSVRVEEIMNDYPDCFKDTSIHQLFGNFHDGELPELRVSRATTHRTSQVVNDDQDEELQRALQESLKDQQSAKDNAMDEYQREMQQYYHEMRGEDPDMSERGLSDMPPLEQALQQVPVGGISFLDLTKLLNIFNHDPEALQYLADGVFSTATVKGGLLYPPQPVEDDSVNTTSKTPGGLSSGQRKSGEGTSETPGSRRASGSVASGSPFVNMPTLATPTGGQTTPDPAKFGSAEHRPAPTPEFVVPDIPAQGLTTMAKLPGEMVRIRAGVRAHIANWKASFPRSEDCTWIELKAEERSSVVRHINAYVHAHDLWEKQDPKTQGHTVNQFLINDARFPVARGQNLKAITAAVKKVYQEYNTKKKNKVAKSSGGNDDDEDEDDAVVGPSGSGSPARPARRRAPPKGPRRRGAATPGTDSDEDGGGSDEEGGGSDAPAGPHQPGRLRRPTTTGQKRGRTISSDDEAGEEEAGEAQGASKKARARHVVYDDDDDDDDVFDPNA
jgi:hypothetical protein